MNTNYSLLTFLALFFFVGCEKSDIEHENAFERSYRTWQEFKAASNNSYRYEVAGATWVGSAWSTTITVREGAIVQRDFHYTRFNDHWMPDGGWEVSSAAELLADSGITDDFKEQEGHTLLEALQWTETGADLGIHEQTPASAVQTLDDIYETARTVWLKKRHDADISFEAKNDGLISSAGFVPNGCADDCFTGISIRSVEAL